MIGAGSTNQSRQTLQSAEQAALSIEKVARSFSSCVAQADGQIELVGDVHDIVREGSEISLFLPVARVVVPPFLLHQYSEGLRVPRCCRTPLHQSGSCIYDNCLHGCTAVAWQQMQ